MVVLIVQVNFNPETGASYRRLLQKFLLQLFPEGSPEKEIGCCGINSESEVAAGIRVSEAHKLYHEKNRPVAADFINKLLHRENKWELK